MRAIVITGTGGPEVLSCREVPMPEPRGAQVRVRVHAAAINRSELLQARGHYPAPPGAPTDIPGLEYAGEIESLGPDVIGPHRVGDRVFGLVGGGGLAEYVVTHERLLAPIPENLDNEQAAAVPEVFITAHDALETQGQVQPGERVLIHAVGGGVGSAAVQIAHAMGCAVFGTSRTAEKLKRCRELGLDIGINTSDTDFADVIARETAGQGVHAVIDPIGASAWGSNLKSLTTQGRLVLVGMLGGAKIEADLGMLLARRLTVVGTTLRARPLEQKIEATRRFAERVVPWLARGTLRPIIDRVYPLSEVRVALERMAANEGFGKIILNISD